MNEEASHKTAGVPIGAKTQKIKQRNPDCTASVGVLAAHTSLQHRSEGVKRTVLMGKPSNTR